MNRHERQRYRATTGRYAATPKCEACGRNPRAVVDGKVIDYFSHRRLDGEPFRGRGIVLCYRCAVKIDALLEGEAMAMLRRRT